VTVKYWTVIGVPAIGNLEHKVCKTEEEAQTVAETFRQNGYRVTTSCVSEEIIIPVIEEINGQD
jgi:hypothetical protein